MADTPEKRMWRSIHHDRKSDSVLVTFDDDSLYKFQAIHRFYSTDKKPIDKDIKPYISNKTDIYGNPVYEFVGNLNQETKARRLVGDRQGWKKEKNGTITENCLCEVDVAYTTRWLDEYYTGQEEINVDKNKINICFLDIEVATQGKFPTAKKAACEINCITIYFSRDKKYYTFGLQKALQQESLDYYKSMNAEYIRCPSEKELLIRCFNCISKNGTDVLTGWNSDFYDFPYITNRAKLLDVPIKMLSRFNTINGCREYADAVMTKKGDLLIAGTECLDFLKLYKKYTLKEEASFKLDAIGKKVVGESKAPLKDGYLTYRTDWDQFILYNLQDVALMVKIEEKKKMFETTFVACAEAHVPFASIFSAKKMIVGFALNLFHSKNMVFPPLVQKERESFPGAYVYAMPGYKQFLISYDYRSMYPSIIMGANISPETKMVFPIGVNPPKGLDLVKSPWTHNGQYQVYYRKDKVGMVVQLTEKLFGGRSRLKKLMKKAKKEGNYALAEVYDMKQKAYKIFGNSLYGLLGNPHFQLYDIDNSATITAFGRDLIQFTTKNLCEYFDNEVTTSEAFKELFGYNPVLNPEYIGYASGEVAEETVYVDAPNEVDESQDTEDSIADTEEKFYTINVITKLDAKVDEIHRRLSHGDTDSFFVKMGDVAEPFLARAGKELGIYVFEKDKLVERNFFDISDEKLAKKDFNRACLQYLPKLWNNPELSQEEINGKKNKAFMEGLLSDDNIKIVYCRFDLTDFSRIYDYAIMENKLNEIMADFGARWNYYDPDQIFLKREKCIRECIVTAMKKYICTVESNEDIRYMLPMKKKESEDYKTAYMENANWFCYLDYGVTGLEIVRSSTSKFTRERVSDMVKFMLRTMDKEAVRVKYMEARADFVKHVENGEYFDIAIPSGISADPPDWLEYQQMPDKERKKIDWRLRAGSLWNYLIENDEELSKTTYEPMFEASKVKFFKVAPNSFGLSSMAVSSQDAVERMFHLIGTPDWDDQWRSTYKQTMERFFAAVGWGTNIETDVSATMMDMM
jgi:DNA polymerase elongation subunit (family B)